MLLELTAVANGGLKEAWLKNLYFSATMGQADYEHLLCSVRWPLHAVSEFSVALQGWAEVPEIPHLPWCQGHFGPSDKGSGEIIQLSIISVSHILGRPFTVDERQCIWANKGNPEWAVAAMLLGLNCLDSGIAAAIYKYRMHSVPFKVWDKAFKPWYLASGRCSILDGVDANAAAVLMLRKVFNCCYRSKEEADWAQERINREQRIPVHMLLTSDGMLDVGAWERSMTQHAVELAELIVSGMTNGPRLDSLDEWWDARWATTPSGSTSMRHISDAVVESDPRLGSSARPNKKSAWEWLPDTTPYDILASWPRKFARGSTKPEPARKQRALYADDDAVTIIASYASVHVEKFMNVWGMKAKQAPADVADWLGVRNYMKPGNIWLSLDYADFNAEHTHYDMAAFDYALALAWSRSGLQPNAKAAKVFCSIWVALSHRNAWVKDKVNGQYRVFGTLFSGSRNTARDNTALHGLYSRVCAKAAVQFDELAVPTVTNYTGDDEDSVFPDWVGAQHYLLTHAMAGFVINGDKQKAGIDSHTFLQREAVAGGLPVRPMFASLATLASGNWYHDVHVWYDNAVPTISDNMWDLHLRGMPLLYARKYAIELLDATMRAPMEDGSWRPLEWWAYRHGAGVHPLWYGMSGKTAVQPTIEAKVPPSDIAARNGAWAWLKSRERRARLTLSEENRDKYMAYLVKESHAALYVKSRVKNHLHFAQAAWPERSSAPLPRELLVNPIPAVDPDEIRRMAGWLKIDRRPTTLDEILSRMGLDAKFVEFAGGLSKVLQGLPPRLMGVFENPVNPRAIPLKYRRLDPALQSWLAFGTATNLGPVEHRATITTPRAMLVAWKRLETMSSFAKKGRAGLVWIISPNAAGKTTFCNSRVGAADMDSIVARTGLRQKIRAWSRNPETAQWQFLGRSVMELILANGPLIVCSQWDPRLILLPAAERPFDIIPVAVAPPIAVLRTRMQARGWDPERIERRVTRWTALLGNLQRQRPHVFSRNEWDQFKVYTSFDALPSWSHL